MRRFFFLFLIFTLAFTLTACSDKGGDELIIAVPVPKEYALENTTFLDGVVLAKREIEEMDLPVTLRVQVDDDHGNFSDAVVLAQSYIDDPTVIGVIGHWFSDVCMPLSNMYRQGEKLLLIPMVSVSRMTEPPSDYLFRIIPNDDQVSHAMCDYAQAKDTKRAVIYYEDSDYGFSMSAEMERYAETLGIKIVDRICAPGDLELSDLSRKWAALEYDTVFVVANVNEGTSFVNRLTDLGFTGRYVCSDGMDVDSVLTELNANSNEVVIATTFNNEISSPEMRDFISRFREEFGKEPDFWSVQGYDSVMLIAKAVRDGDVRTSKQLSAYLSAAETIGSVYGSERFNERHELVGRAVYMKAIGEGEFYFEGN
jgi:branched-chain amino acid transport system substrate-binding protein